VTPVGPVEVGVAVLCGGGEPYERWLTRFPALLQRLEGAVPTSPVRGAGPLRQQATARRCGRTLLVGDAAGYVDALTGEGMAVGFAGAAALLRCVAADRPQDYDRAWRQVTRRPRLLTEALLQATRVPAVRAALVPAARAAPPLFDAAVRVLA
jgi:flavin-dependent dehydrogenase